MQIYLYFHLLYIYIHGRFWEHNNGQNPIKHVEEETNCEKKKKKEEEERNRKKEIS